MTAPRPFTVFLVVVMVVLAGIYVLGLGLGLERTRPHGLTELAEALGSNRAVSLNELSVSRSAECRIVPPERLEIRPDGTCNLTAGRARAWQRRALVVEWAPNLQVSVKPNEESAVEIEGETEEIDEEQRKKPVSFPLPSAGARVTIKCAAGTSPCTATLTH